jgi:hypothetical protein
VRGALIVSIAACVALQTAQTCGQSSDPHAAMPERPSVATHAQTVAPGWIELEFGVDRPRADGRFGATGVPVAVKLGLTPRAQLTIAPSISKPAGGSFSFGGATAGVKYRILDHAPVFGAVAMLPSVSTPVGSGRATDQDAVSLLVISSRSLGAVSLDLNAGYTRRAGRGAIAPRHETLWAVSLDGPLWRRLEWMGEISGSPRTRGPAGREGIVNALAGINARLTPSIVLDVATLVPISGNDSFVVLGGAVWNLGQLFGRP